MASEFTRSNRIGKVRGMYNIISFHLMADHLAVVRNTGYTFEVKRYGFGDIVSLVAARSKLYLIAPVIWGILLLAAALMLNKWVLGVAALGLAIDLAFGPRGSLEIRTAHSLDQISHICRLRKGRKIVDAVSKRVEEVQGRLISRDPAPESFADVTYAGHVPPRPPPAPAGLSASDLLKPGYTGLYLTLWSMIIPALVLSVAGFFYTKILAVAPFAFCGSMIGMIYVMVKLNRFPTATRLMKAVSWYGVGSACAALIVCVGYYYVSYFSLTVQRPGEILSNVDVLIDMTKTRGYPTVMQVLSINLLLASLLCGSVTSRAISLLEQPSPPA